MTELQINEQGALYLPPELVGQIPTSSFTVEIKDNMLILRPDMNRKPFWMSASNAERAEAFRQWAMSHETGVGLSDEAVSRESFYD